MLCITGSLKEALDGQSFYQTDWVNRLTRASINPLIFWSKLIRCGVSNRFRCWKLAESSTLLLPSAWLTERLNKTLCWSWRIEGYTLLGRRRRKGVPVSRCHRNNRISECVRLISIQFNRVGVLNLRKSHISHKWSLWRDYWFYLVRTKAMVISIKKRKGGDRSTIGSQESQLMQGRLSVWCPPLNCIQGIKWILGGSSPQMLAIFERGANFSLI